MFCGKLSFLGDYIRCLIQYPTTVTERHVTREHFSSSVTSTQGLPPQWRIQEFQYEGDANPMLCQFSWKDGLWGKGSWELPGKLPRSAAPQEWCKDLIFSERERMALIWSLLLCILGLCVFIHINVFVFALMFDRAENVPRIFHFFPFRKVSFLVDIHFKFFLFIKNL